MNDKAVLPAALTGVAQSVERYTRRAGGRGFDSWGKSYTQSLKLTKEEGICVAQITTPCKTGVPVSCS